MTHLIELDFIKNGRAELESTRFQTGPLDRARLAVRGKTGGAHPTPYTFQWTGGVQALTILLVASAEAKNVVVLRGGRNTVLRSLDFALSKPKRHQWLLDLFGLTPRGDALALRLLRRSNPTQRRGDILHLSLNEELLPPEAITVRLDGRVLFESELKPLLEELLDSVGKGISRAFQEPQEREAAKDDELESPVEENGPRFSPAYSVTPALREIAFVSPAVEGKPFYSEVLERVVMGASRIRFPQYRVVPFLPTRSFDPLELWSLVRQVELHSRPNGIILIPDDPDNHVDDLFRVVRASGAPLLLLDVNFAPGRFDPQARAGLPPFVGGDESEGGRLAAQLFLEHFAKFKIDAPFLIILKATTTRWENERALSFERTILSSLPRATIQSVEGLQYERDRAKTACLILFRSGGELNQIDGIFSCNDDMALGGRSAIVLAHRAGVRFREHIRVVGYDGIKEMKGYIDNGDPFILGTVDVQIEQQVTTALEVLQHLMEGRKEYRGTETLIQPRLYQFRESYDNFEPPLSSEWF